MWIEITKKDLKKKIKNPASSSRVRSNVRFFFLTRAFPLPSPCSTTSTCLCTSARAAWATATRCWSASTSGRSTTSFPKRKAAWRSCSARVLRMPSTWSSSGLVLFSPWQMETLLHFVLRTHDEKTSYTWVVNSSFTKHNSQICGMRRSSFQADPGRKYGNVTISRHSKSQKSPKVSREILSKGKQRFLIGFDCAHYD